MFSFVFHADYRFAYLKWKVQRERFKKRKKETSFSWNRKKLKTGLLHQESHDQRICLPDGLKPDGWDNLADEKPILHSFSDISIYEMHIRDFR